MASPGRPCGLAHIASRTLTCRHAAGVTGVTPSAFPHIPRTSSYLCSWQGSTVSPHSRSSCKSPQNHVPVWGHAPITVQQSRHESAVTFPCSRLAVTSLCYPTSPWSRSHSHSQSVPMPMGHCSEWRVLLMGAFKAPSSKPGACLAWPIGTPGTLLQALARFRVLGCRHHRRLELRM
jgi:hypothetical protein